MARYRRLSNPSPDPGLRASPNRRVNFKRRLISGPSGSGLQPSVASVTSSEGPTSEPHSESEDDGIHGVQLQSDLNQIAQQEDHDPAKDDTPDTADDFWLSLQAGASPQKAAHPFNTLTCAQKDYRVCKGMNFLTNETVQFAKEKVGRVDKKRFMNELLIDEENRVLIRYIGCIAQGGPKGEDGWKKLLTDESCRQALIIGVVGRAMEENVFSELFFGGDSVLVERLDMMEKEQVDDEGFSRTQSRAEAIIASKPYRKLESFERHVEEITSQLSSMLDTFCEKDVTLDSSLYSIIYHAGQLSCMMRIASDVVYYWPPTFKDEEFEPGRMEAYNLGEMIEESPYDRKSVNGHERAVLKPGKEDQSEAIVRVVCFPGLVAYRQFGGELAKREIEAEKAGIPVPVDVQAHRRRAGEYLLTTHQGIRSKVIRKSLVLLQWGKQRLLTKEAGTSSHIDAVRDGNMGKYEKDYASFVELYSVAEKKWTVRGGR